MKLQDLTGQRFGRLVVKGISKDKVTRGRFKWDCVCDCGAVTSVRGSSLKNDNTRSCGCLKKDELSKRTLKDIRGQRFGRLIAVEIVDRGGRDQPVTLLCKCDCGNEVRVKSVHLRRGATRSCGCLQKETIRERRILKLIGMRFGRLLVVSESTDRGKDGGVIWNCKCDCGNNASVKSSYLLSGDTKSCGCLGVEHRMKADGMSEFNRVYARYRNNAREKGYGFGLSKQEFRHITSKNCFYCGAAPSNKSVSSGGRLPYIYNGIDRVDNAAGYVEGNIVPCCSMCNIAKNKVSYAEFVDWAKRLYNHLMTANATHVQ